LVESQAEPKERVDGSLTEDALSNAQALETVAGKRGVTQRRAAILIT